MPPGKVIFISQLRFAPRDITYAGVSEHQPWGRGKLEPLGALTVGVLLLGTGGGVCWSAILNIAEIVLKSSAIPVEEVQAAQHVFHLIYSNPMEAIWKLKNEEVLSTAGITVTVFSIVTKEALFRYTLYEFPFHFMRFVISW